jgi:hypothetical protein
MLGLNIVPPLYQGVSLGKEIQRTFTLCCQDSVDWDIKEWPSIHSKQKQKEWQPGQLFFELQDYVNVLLLAAKKTVEVEFPTRIITPGHITDLMGWTIELQRALRNTNLDLISPTIPFGMLDAKIGIVFD